MKELTIILTTIGILIAGVAGLGAVIMWAITLNDTYLIGAIFFVVTEIWFDRIRDSQLSTTSNHVDT